MTGRLWAPAAPAGPAAAQPAAGQPAVSEPAVSEPAAAETGRPQPAAAEAAAGEPGGAQRAVSDPGPQDAGAAQAAPEPGPPQPAAADPAAAAEAAEPEAAEPEAEAAAAGSRKRRRRAWLASIVLLVVTAGFAAWAGVFYVQSASSGALALGQTRDQVLAAAHRDLADLNSVRPGQVSTWQARWLADTTGAEHTNVQRTAAAARAQIKKVKTSSVATVTSAAVIRLDSAAGTAQVIATVRVRQTAQSGATSTITNRYLAGLTQTGSGWKISSLNAQ